jgi:hypothetical protein
MQRQGEQPGTIGPNVQARMDELTRCGQLLGPAELATALGVKRSWVYSRTRLADCGGLPVIWVGKYPRFELGAVLSYLRTRPHPKAE